MATNITPDDAIVITALPYSVTIARNVDLVESTYIPSCGSNYRDPLWWVYTTGASETAIGVTFDASSGTDGDYYPGLSLWTGTPPSLTEVNDRCFTWGATHPVYLQFNVEPSTTYYFQFVNTNGSGTDPGNLEWSLLEAASDAAPVGSFFVPNDQPGYPASIMAAADGTLLRTFGFPACEMGATLPSGIVCIAAGIMLESFNLYTSQLVLITAITSLIDDTYTNISPVTTDKDQTFYVSRVRNGIPSKVTAISDAGVIGATTELPAESDQMCCMAYDPDLGILYYATDALTPIRRYDLVNDTPLSDLADPAASQMGRDMEVLPNGDLLVVLRTDSTHWVVQRWSPAGVLQATYPLDNEASPNAHPRIRVTKDGLSFVAMTWPTGTVTGDESEFTTILIADGSETSQVFSTIKEYNYNGPPAFGTSQSCPLLLLFVALAPTPGPGTVQPIRFCRRFGYPSTETNFVFLSNLQIICQTGVGLSTGQGEDPVMMIRITKDGGHTWGPERFVTMGAMGQYRYRARIPGSLGRVRPYLLGFEVVVSDPVNVTILSATVDMAGGTA